jgi:MFS family permease
MAGPLRRNRDFRLLWISQAISSVGSRITLIALPLLVLALTGSPARAGVIGFVQTLPFLVFFLPAGALVDRLDRKRLMLGSDAVRITAFATLVIAILMGEPSLWHIAAVALLEGAFFVLFDLSEAAALPLIVPKEQLPTAIAQNQARLHGADLAGQPIGGFLFEIGRVWPFVVDAVSYVVSFVLVAFIRPKLQEDREPDDIRLRQAVAEGLRWVWKQTFLRSVIILVGGSNFVFNGVMLVLIVRARELDASASTIGLLLACNGVGAIVGAGVGPAIQRTVPTRFVVMGSMWLWFFTIAGMAPLSNIPLIGVLLFLSATGGPIFNVATGSYIYALAPDRLQGRVRSVSRAIAWGMVPLGTLAGGFLAEALGGAAALAWLAAIMFVVAVASTLTRSIRHAPSIDDLLSEGAASA